MAKLLSGRFIKISQEEKVIVNKDGVEEGKYYIIGLSNGEKSFDVTTGSNNSILAIGMFAPCDVDFDVDARKLKIIDAFPVKINKEQQAVQSPSDSKDKNFK